jgi:hypothetical protein
MDMSNVRSMRIEFFGIEGVKEHVPPCVVLVINDNPYGLILY